MTVSGGLAAAAADVAALAALLGDRTRATFCIAMLDGRAWTAGELARAAGVRPATASEHLDRLVRSGLLAEERQGRHRYLRLAGPEAAGLVESLATAAQAGARRPTSYAAVRADAALVAGRTCYDHLAGRLGVALLDGLDHRGYVGRVDGITLTEGGADWLASLGIDVPALRAAPRPVVRACLDWTERRHHLAGSAGAAIAAAFTARGWITRGPGRVAALTSEGAVALARDPGLGQHASAPLD